MEIIVPHDIKSLEQYCQDSINNLEQFPERENYLSYDL